MTKETEQLFKDLLINLPNSGVTEHSLTAFSLLQGRHFTHDLLVVGRAVNGWVANWGKSESSEQANKIIQDLKDKETKEYLDWPYNKEGVSDEYNPNKSAFWRVIKRVVLERKISPAHEDWSNYIAWSNLYKISDATGGNPSTSLCDYQREKAKAILLNDIAECKPKNVLFLTGDWVYPFIEGYHVEQESANDIRRGTLTYNTIKTNCIIAPHPEGKQETPIVEQILKYMK